MNTSEPLTIQQRIGEQIRLARVKRRMSQRQLAIACNFTQQTISDFELGKTEPRLTDAIALCKALGLVDVNQPSLVDSVTVGRVLL